jgi:hypothetical protein
MVICKTSLTSGLVYALASVKFPAKNRVRITMTIWLMRRMAINLYIFLRIIVPRKTLVCIKSPPSMAAGGHPGCNLLTQIRIHIRVKGQLIEMLDIFQRIERQFL